MHNLEIINGEASMFYCGEKPWHGLGQQLDSPATSKEAIEAIPLNEIAYHAGTSAGNTTSIGIEICDSAGLVGEKQAIELIASLLIEKNWDIEKVRTHKSWSGKDCPHIILPRWTQFIRDVETEVKKQKLGTGIVVENTKEVELFDKTGKLLGKINI